LGWGHWGPSKSRRAPAAGTVITVLFIIFNHRKNIEEFMGKKEEEAPPDRDER
jgi:hypothetical protein